MLLVDARSFLQHAVRVHVNHITVLVYLTLTLPFRLHSDHHFGQLYHVALYDAAVALSICRLHLNLACLTLTLLAHPHTMSLQHSCCVFVSMIVFERGKLDVGSGVWSLHLRAQAIRQVLHPMIPLDSEYQPAR